jgi:predicted aconitase
MGLITGLRTSEKGGGFMLHLNKDEQRMLGGEQGSSVQKAMELLIKVGEAHGAERMINVSQAFVSELSKHVLFSAEKVSQVCAQMISEMANDAVVKVPTAAYPLALSLRFAKETGLPESMIEEERRVLAGRAELYQRLGIIPSHTCHPHFIYDLRKGEHVAFMETNIGMLANSWFGAMTNLDGYTTSMASAITGKTPEYGLHLPENRYGKVVIKIAPDLEPDRFDYADYVALAHWTGKVLLDRIAVYQGLPGSLRPSQAKYMCASQIFNSSVGMFHIAGVTPEAPTLDAALGGKKPEETFVFGRKEKREAYEYFCTASDRKVDMVNIGCPHCTLQEIGDIARLIKGRRVHKDVKLLIGASEHIVTLGKRMGFVGAIEDAGGLVVSDMCIRRAALPPLSDELGVRVVASTSGSVAQIAYRRSRGTTGAWFGTTKNCIDAAVTGKWGGE